MGIKDGEIERVLLVASTAELFQAALIQAANQGCLVGPLGFRVPKEWPPTELTVEWGAPINESHTMAGENAEGKGIWLIVAKEPEPTLIGFALVTISPLRDGDDAEITIEILPEFHNRRFGTDTCKALLKYLFGRPEIVRISAICGNCDGISILKQAGFVQSRECAEFFELTRGLYCTPL